MDPLSWFSEQEKWILKRQPIWLSLLKLLFEVASFGLFLSFAIQALAQHLEPPWYYFIYFSYWSISISLFAFLTASFCSLLRGFKYYYKRNPIIYRKSIERVNVALNTFQYIRDRLLVLAFIESLYITVAFWTTLRDSADPLAYASIGAHIVQIFLLLIEFVLTTIHVSWWDLWIALGYFGNYFLFLIYLRYSVGRWLYAQLDPSINSLWWVILIISFFAILAIYLIVSLLNFIRNRTVLSLCWEFGSEGLSRRLTFEKVFIPHLDKRTYLRSQMLMSLVIMTLLALFRVFVMILFWFANPMGHDFVGNMTFEILYIIFEIINVSVGMKANLELNLNTSIRSFWWFLHTNLIANLFIFGRIISDFVYIGLFSYNQDLVYYYATNAAFCFMLYLHRLFVSLWAHRLFFYNHKQRNKIHLITNFERKELLLQQNRLRNTFRDSQI